MQHEQDLSELTQAEIPLTGSGRMLAILIEDFREFSQSFHATAIAVPQIWFHPLPSRSFQFIIH
jgi:hypothetical protein